MSQNKSSSRNIITVISNIVIISVSLYFGTSCVPSDSGTPQPNTVTPVVTVSQTATFQASTNTPSVTNTASPTNTPVITSTPGGLPDMPDKPKPQSSTFQGCPPQGDGGDPALNLLKNRIDEGNYVPVSFDAIFNLTWPKAIEYRDRAKWSAEDTAIVAKSEGIPVIVEGYIYGAKESGAESASCHGTSSDMVDWHVWFTKNPGEDRTHSIVIEPTPRSRANHKWTIKIMEDLAKNQTPVRISGWVFLDPEHPDQVGKTRGTIWEIHPVMQIEFQQNGQWLPLDSLVP
jgi:hypothetical protein